METIEYCHPHCRRVIALREDIVSLGDWVSLREAAGVPVVEFDRPRYLPAPTNTRDAIALRKRHRGLDKENFETWIRLIGTQAGWDHTFLLDAGEEAEGRVTAVDGAARLEYRDPFAPDGWSSPGGADRWAIEAGRLYVFVVQDGQAVRRFDLGPTRS